MNTIKYYRNLGLNMLKRTAHPLYMSVIDEEGNRYVMKVNRKEVKKWRGSSGTS